jgi:hypothetical protein
MTRAFTRSVRTSLATSIAEIPSRAARSLRRRLRPPVPSESDSVDEKQRYLSAVVAAEG